MWLGLKKKKRNYIFVSTNKTDKQTKQMNHRDFQYQKLYLFYVHVHLRVCVIFFAQNTASTVDIAFKKIYIYIYRHTAATNTPRRLK